MQKLREIFSKKQIVISFEVFPPKKEYPLESILKTIDELTLLKPDFISVTYGAGGSTRGRTIEIASYIWERHKIPSVAHLTCIAHTKQEINDILKQLIDKDITNILALRGDKPADGTIKNDFKYAFELIRYIHKTYPDTFSVAAAAYPEGHIESESLEKDIIYLKQKVESGVDLLITQLFFDNEIFFNFMERLQKHNINVPVTAGIMPVTNVKQISRIVSLCGASIPSKLSRIMAKYEHNPTALKKAGIIYALEQIIDLISWGVKGIHIYTMNKKDVASFIIKELQEIIKGET